MPSPPQCSRWSKPLRRFRHTLTSNIFGRPGPMTLQTSNMLSFQKAKRIWDQSRLKEVLGLTQPREHQHFGPRARIPDLFQRRDQIYFALEAQQLQWFARPPPVYHDLLHAAAKVGHIEERIGYVFKDTMTCIEALKVTPTTTPLYYKGVIHKPNRNNRLALLGDRVLGLALCEIWFYTGNTTGSLYTYPCNLR
jgi:hypothetical protein